MSAANIEMLERASIALGDLVDKEVVFVGGATVGLWATDEATAEFRPTDDIDVIVEVASRNDYYRFEERLRALGFVNDDEDGVICRFRHEAQGLILDVLPTDPSILGYFEDVITLADRREELVEEVRAAPDGLRAYVAAELGALLDHRDFDSAAEGALSGGPETQARFEVVVRPRVEAIVAAGRA
jgi:hypothetical protein